MILKFMNLPKKSLKPKKKKCHRYVTPSGVSLCKVTSVSDRDTCFDSLLNVEISPHTCERQVCCLVLAQYSGVV